MDNFLKAMAIFQKYIRPGSYNYKYPFQCEHDTMHFFGIIVPRGKEIQDIVSKEDIDELEKLGFEVTEDNDGFLSFAFGSC